MFIYIYIYYVYIYNVYIYIYIYVSTESCLGAPSCMPLMDTLHHFHPFNPLIFQRPCSSWPICDTVPLPPKKRWLLYRICSYVLEHITVYNCGQSLIVQNKSVAVYDYFPLMSKRERITTMHPSLGI